MKRDPISATPPKPSPPGKRARTRDQLLMAAQTVLLSQSASSLTIRQIADAAGMVHASFYNYYPTVEHLLDDLADLVLMTHAVQVAPLRASVTDPINLFALISRQTLRLGAEAPALSKLLFDSGLAIDRVLTALHVPLRADLKAGMKAGAFRIAKLDLTVTMVTGAMIALAVEIYRGRAKAAAIDDLTVELLLMLGVPPAKAQKHGRAKLEQPPTPPLPLSWRALGLAPPQRNWETPDVA